MVFRKVQHLKDGIFLRMKEAFRDHDEGIVGYVFTEWLELAAKQRG